MLEIKQSQKRFFPHSQVTQLVMADFEPRFSHSEFVGLSAPGTAFRSFL